MVLIPVSIITVDGEPVANLLAGDIGNTAEAYATGYYDVQGHHVVTVNPLMGEDSIRPFLRRGRRVLVPLSFAWGTGLAEAVVLWVYHIALEHPPRMVGLFTTSEEIERLGPTARLQALALC